MINLTQKEVESLRNFANEIPTKYGLPILQFFINKEQEQEQEVSKKDKVKK